MSSSDTTVSRLNAALDGRYEIERKIGKGGMATVFLAKDRKHNRSVALKVLKPELAAVVGAERFLAEIETTANLQHPHILPLYDSGEADGLLFYVMPHVEGESLRDRLGREHQLPVDDAVRIATNMAEALDYAHRQGVIHRDIKPANVLLQDGKPVISDFGIALAVGVAGGGRLTETGLSLGTPHYMSPEQATGDQSVGPASDVYSLGCVLYEMLVGVPPYTGSTPQAVLGQIITSPAPAAREHRDTVPVHVDAAISRALSKVPADRFARAAQFASAIRGASAVYSTVAGPSVVTRVSPRWRAAAVAGVLGTVGLGAAYLGATDAEPYGPVMRYAIDFPVGQELRSSFENSIALSRDGRRLVYAGPGEDGGTALWLKERDQLDARRLPDTEGASNPTFSPDGRRIAFIQSDARTLFTLDLDGGEPLALVDNLARTGVSWADDGNLYVTDVESGVLLRVSPATGARDQVTSLLDGEGVHVQPAVLPGSQVVIFTIWHDDVDQNPSLASARIDGSEHHVLVAAEAPFYESSGHLIAVRVDGTLLAAPFDPTSLEPLGEFVLLDLSVAKDQAVNEQGVDLALADDGTLLYLAEQSAEGRQIAWFDQGGSMDPLDHSWSGPLESVSLSPDGIRFLATVGFNVGSEIWMGSVDGSLVPTRFAAEGEVNRRPTWFGGGDSVAYIAARGGDRDAMIRAADGSGTEAVLLDLEADVDEVLVHDSEWIVYRTGTVSGDRDIYAVRREPGAEPIPVAARPGVDEISPVLSADGRWLAYVEGDGGPDAIWVQSFPDPSGARLRISGSGSQGPLWLGRGHDLAFSTGTHLVRARIATEPNLALIGLDELFELAEAGAGDLRTDYSYSEDRELFLMVRRPSRTELILVTNFGDLLRQQMAN